MLTLIFHPCLYSFMKFLSLREASFSHSLGVGMGVTKFLVLFHLIMFLFFLKASPFLKGDFIIYKITIDHFCTSALKKCATSFRPA